MKKTDYIKKSIPYCLAGFLCVFLSLAVRTVTVNGNLNWNSAYIFKSIGIAFISGFAVGYLISLMINLGLVRIQKENISKNSGFLKIFIPAFAAMAIVYFIFFLAYYPGILSYDSYSQIRQLVDHDYYEHHPLFHTMMIGLCTAIGKTVFGNVNVGAAIYSILQIILFSVCPSYGIYVLFKRNHVIASIATIVIFALYPFNAYMAVTMTKDVLFSSSFLLLFIAITEAMRKDISKRERILNSVLIVVSGFGTYAFRNNGKYVLIVVLLISLLYCLIVLINKKDEKNETKKYLKICTMIISSIVLGFIILFGLAKGLNAAQGDKREMLSVPIQQLARTYVYHAGTGLVDGGDDSMDVYSREYIEELFANDGALLYNPYISDPVKRETITSVIRYDIPRFAKVYTSLLIKYPSDYINAFLALDAGYIDIGDETHAHINEVSGVQGLGYVQTRWSEEYLNSVGFYRDSKLLGLEKVLDGFANSNMYLSIPLAKYFFMPGIWLWFYIVCLIASFTLKKYNNLIPLSLIAGYYLTIFFGPCVQLRYLYPVMIVAPFVLLLFEKDTYTGERKE